MCQQKKTEPISSMDRCNNNKNVLEGFIAINVSRISAYHNNLRRSVITTLMAIGFLLLGSVAIAQPPFKRIAIDLNSDWRTIAGNNENPVAPAFQPELDDSKWKQVSVPHNWDDYHGYRRLLHGNKHGDAWYRRTVYIKQPKGGKRFFLFFEGVGSYATVYWNGHKVGEHAGGRTTFTIDITHHIKTDGTGNLLAVRAWHPPFIKDLPWVCGGCSDERGFSEGSQPMGIFRPVQLLITNELRIEPFGVHAWAELRGHAALLNINASVKNYGARQKSFTIVHHLVDKNGAIIKKIMQKGVINAIREAKLSSKNITISQVNLWSVEDPYLYKIVSIIKEGTKEVDRLETDFGFRTVNWKTPTHQFHLNGKPVFINGVAEYEHLIGQSHAFSKEQVIARVKWLEAAGFNAFRDGHQPHNLLYGKLFNQKGILWWTQLSAHVWYDTPEFKANFKQLLREWVIERRNDPSVVLWGLQNESKIPEGFARECTQLIRSLDPTAASQRLVTTCNGGEGTDWDVPQNWTGTYGGNPDTYGEDLKKQVLVGEYGAWRTLDLHTEGGYQQNGPVSEDRFTQLMEKKVRLAESVKDSVAGHFFWLLTSHDNPGRVQGGEGLRELDRVGPVNYKGMLTPWEEPTDVFYMFRSNYVPASQQPMVYIASHTWPNRWMKPGNKDSIIVYSNCDEVELFNDIDALSLGKQERKGRGTPFMWHDVDIRFNVLYAVGYVKGKPVVRDTLTLFHLPKAPHFDKLYKKDVNITLPNPAYRYVYRINCGGADYLDQNGNWWKADRTLPGSVVDPPPPGDTTQLYGWQASRSWSDAFPEIPANFASQRRTFVPVGGSKDAELFQSFRYGKEKLTFRFPLKNGNYLVELYFSEPWIGIGGGMDGTGMRLFDVAFNGVTVLYDLDIWKQAGTNGVIKKTIPFAVTNMGLVISFPESKAGQAIINAIAIATAEPQRTASAGSPPGPALLWKSTGDVTIQSWLDIGNKVYTDKNIQVNELPPALYGSDWFQRPEANQGILDFSTPMGADIYIAVDENTGKPAAIKEFEKIKTPLITDENGGRTYLVYKKRFKAGSHIRFEQTKDWIIALNFPDKMQPAYDLKPTISYKADIATVNSSVVKEVVAGAARTVVKHNDQAVITWPVATGVADMYSISIKYNSPLEQDITASVQLLDASDNVMANEVILFKYTRPGKWNYVTVNTGGMINAGNYRVTLLLKNAKGLVVSNIDIQ